MTWSASAPANIALIKYMGKAKGKNIPLNSSLSLTLNHLTTQVQLDKSSKTKVETQGEVELSNEGRLRFEKFFKFLCEQFKIKGEYLITTQNNFPSDCGLASSASSFAALTLATAELAKTKGDYRERTPEELAILSRQGSGSSCRSLFFPFGEWTGEKAYPSDLPDLKLEHLALIVSRDKKNVSSSEAHQRVLTSPLIEHRAQRAHQRMVELKIALLKDWTRAVKICWAEFWEMHTLFETCAEPFGYMTDVTLKILRELYTEFEVQGDGPIITMDAGPNIHLIFRNDQTELKNKIKAQYSDVAL